jgi:hypothetical protein
MEAHIDLQNVGATVVLQWNFSASDHFQFQSSALRPTPARENIGCRARESKLGRFRLLTAHGDHLC